MRQVQEADPAPHRLRLLRHLQGPPGAQGQGFQEIERTFSEVTRPPFMSNRHLARTVAMQTLYERDFHGGKMDDPDAAVARNLEEFAPGLDDKGFAKELVDGVLKHQKDIDATITKYAPAWPLPQITIVDRN